MNVLCENEVQTLRESHIQKRYINMVTIYNTPLSTTSEKALFGRHGGGEKPNTPVNIVARECPIQIGSKLLSVFIVRLGLIRLKSCIIIYICLFLYTFYK